MTRTAVHAVLLIINAVCMATAKHRIRIRRKNVQDAMNTAKNFYVDTDIKEVFASPLRTCDVMANRYISRLFKQSTQTKIDTLNTLHLRYTRTPESSHLIPSYCTVAVANGKHSSPALKERALSLSAVCAEYSLYCPKYKPRITSYRDLKHIEHDELINDALSLPWTEVWNLPNIDDKIEKFNDLVIQLYDKHAPLKTRRVGRHPAPWMCDAIKLLMTDRDTAYRKYRRSKDELDFNTYKVLRNKCNQAVRNAKLRHAHSLILPSVSAKELWRNLNNLGLTKAKPRVDNINLSLNSLNEHFVTAPPEPLHKQETLEFLRSYPQPVWDKFFFKYINPTDVMKTLRRMKSKAQETKMVMEKIKSEMYNSGKKTGPTLIADFRALFTPEHDRLVFASKANADDVRRAQRCSLTFIAVKKPCTFKSTEQNPSEDRQR
ncbi:hypothetical protein ANN_08063 [Periplaneta americana]|uniref:Uncharacterized protein n=1 Tax=Periplaneta americana TaxID=6978 RepID=A0ABQ8T0B4_PERAM|nr:hypothetical protein ANN_08063 [Periplaneta americana]